MTSLAAKSGAASLPGCCHFSFIPHPLLSSQPSRTKLPFPFAYTDIRKAAGITFQQDSTQTDEKYYLETMGTGVGWIDYDQDGLMDLYFVQSAPRIFTNPRAHCVPRFTTTMETELSPMSPRRQALAARDIMARAWRWGISTTTAIPI